MRYCVPGLDDAVDDGLDDGFGKAPAEGVGFGSVSGVIVALRLRSSRAIHN